MNKRIIDDITNFIFIRDELRPSDIIFIPGGSHPALGEYAADLYKKGYAKILMPSGGVSIKTGKFGGVKSNKEKYNRNYTSECEFLADVLMKNGVPEKAILFEYAASYTKENACFSRNLADKSCIDVKRAIICCKNFHARRALLCYQFAFPQTEFIMHPVPYFEGNIEIASHNWFETKNGIHRVLEEIQKIGIQFNAEFYDLVNKN